MSRLQSGPVRNDAAPRSPRPPVAPRCRCHDPLPTVPLIWAVHPNSVMTMIAVFAEILFEFLEGAVEAAKQGGEPARWPAPRAFLPAMPAVPVTMGMPDVEGRPMPIMVTRVDHHMVGDAASPRIGMPARPAAPGDMLDQRRGGRGERRHRHRRGCRNRRNGSGHRKSGGDRVFCQTIHVILRVFPRLKTCSNHTGPAGLPFSRLNGGVGIFRRSSR